jgi:hypothetical protein
MQRIRRHVSYANVAATLALVFAMTGGAIAATGGFSSGGQLQACAGSDGTLKLLKPGKKCKKGQKTVAWNQTGRVGAKGVAGAPGAAGATGAPGATGAAGAAGTNGQNATAGDIKWAFVSEDGPLLGSKGVTGTKGSESPYEVSFDRDVSKCAVTATSNDVIPTNKVTVAQHNKPESIRVFIKNAANEEEAAFFSIVVNCP